MTCSYFDRTSEKLQTRMWTVPLTTEQIYVRLTDIFRDLFDDDSIVLKPETTAADISGWDSFNHINLIVATEMQFGIKFKTAEIESLRNVGHFVQVIAAKLG